MIKFLNISLLFFAINISALGQNPSELQAGQTLGKIIAIVGEEIILDSDLESRLILSKQQDPTLNIDDPAIRQQILQSIIDEKLMITKAIEDSILVTEEEIVQRVDFHVARLLRHFGSEKRIEDYYGVSIDRLKYDYRDVFKKQLLAEKLQQQKFMGLKATHREVEDFYKEYKDSLSEEPESIELFHLVRNVEASDNAKEEILELAKKVRDSIQNGGDFADFARRYSNDPGTASDGGDLGWVAKGMLYAEYENAAFELVPGATSTPVETLFGYHLIQTLEKKRDSIRTRHILFKVGTSEVDDNETKEFLNGIRDSILAGGEFEEFAKEYSEEKETKGFGGLLGKMPVNEIPAAMKSIVEGLSDGEISQPYPYTVNPTKKAYHLIYRKRTIPAHFPTLENDYEVLEQQAIMLKQLKLYKEWTAALRNELYWEIVE